MSRIVGHISDISNNLVFSVRCGLYRSEVSDNPVCWISGMVFGWNAHTPDNAILL